MNSRHAIKYKRENNKIDYRLDDNPGYTYDGLAVTDRNISPYQKEKKILIPEKFLPIKF